MTKTLILALLISFALATQYVPVVKRNVGIQAGNPNGEVKIDLIYDPQCDGSYEFDQTFQAAWNSLTSAEQNRISLRFISLSLPYHIVSQKMTQAIIYAQQHKDDAAALRLFRDFLANIDKYDEQNIQNQTIGALLIRIANRAANVTNLNSQDIWPQLAHGSASDGKTRQWSKVAMGAIKAAGTPRFRVNEVIVDGATDWDAPKLTAFIRSLLSTTEELAVE